MKKRHHLLLLGILFLLNLTTGVAQTKTINPTKTTSTQTITEKGFGCNALSLSPPEQRNHARGVGDKFHLWNIGQTLRIRFLSGTSSQQRQVMQYAREWERSANLQFNVVTSGTSDIRIDIENSDALSFSAIGTEARGRSQNIRTMLLAWNSSFSSVDIRHLVLHEFGHALGLQHEHQHPDSGIRWNREAAYQYYTQNGHSSRASVDHNVLNSYSSRNSYYCTYDQRSIMHYPIPSHITLNNRSTSYNTSLSSEDKNFIARLYPASGGRNSSSCGGFCDANCADYELAINVQGGGTISYQTANGASVQCTSFCTESYERGKSVRLTARAQNGYRFVRWQGTNCNNSTSSTCNITINSQHSVTAIFEEVASKTLSLSQSGNGRITVTYNRSDQECNSSCNLLYPERAAITLKATAASGYRFRRWSGDVCNNGTNSSCSLTLVRDLNVRAIFESTNGTTNNNFDFDVSVTPANCNEGGQFYVSVMNGSPNYTIRIYSNNGIDQTYQVNNHNFQLTDVPQGSYTLRITDNRGRSKTKNLYMSRNCLKDDSVSSSRTNKRVQKIQIQEINTATNLEVSPNMPNPFRDQTLLPFKIARKSTIHCKVFLATGQQVYELEQTFDKGEHVIPFESSIFQNSGMYFYQLSIGEQVKVGKMIRL